MLSVFFIHYDETSSLHLACHLYLLSRTAKVLSSNFLSRSEPSFSHLLTFHALKCSSFCSYRSWHQDLHTLKMPLRELRVRYNVILFNIDSPKPFPELLSGIFGWLRNVFKYQCLRLCRIRVAKRFCRFWRVRLCRSSNRSF